MKVEYDGSLADNLKHLKIQVQPLEEKLLDAFNAAGVEAIMRASVSDDISTVKASSALIKESGQYARVIANLLIEYADSSEKQSKFFDGKVQDLEAKLYEVNIMTEAYESLPDAVRAKLLYRGKDLFKGASLVAEFQPDGTPKTKGPRITQFLTYKGKDANGKDVEKGVVWMPEGSSILPHLHSTDSELYQEVTPDGFILDGKPQKSAICHKGEKHGAEAAPKGGSCIAWEWHEDGQNLDFTLQNFEIEERVL